MSTVAALQCEHLEFVADVQVARLTKVEGGPVTGYALDLKVMCSVCGLRFVFVCDQIGTSMLGPTVSVDGSELRAPIVPGFDLLEAWQFTSEARVLQRLGGHND